MDSSNFGKVALVGALSLLTSCSHGALNKQLDEKISEESAIKTRSDLQAETADLFEKAPGLSAVQRVQLVALRNNTRSESDRLRLESLKLRSVLVKDLISEKYNEAEVELIKKRIKANEQQRLSVLFGAVEKANTILGHIAPKNQNLIHEFFDPRG